jgi:hypothetical protein
VENTARIALGTFYILASILMAAIWCIFYPLLLSEILIKKFFPSKEKMPLHNQPKLLFDN